VDPVIVAAAVVVRDGRYLVGRRPPHKRHGGLWEFPGGKLLDGESLADALSRELREELDLEVTGVGGALGSVTDPDSPFVITFVEVDARGTPRPSEHTEVAWLDPVGLRDAALAPADRSFVDARFPTGESGRSQSGSRD
jgi:8-oxo-dGTP pyrophosphatase MutT (NUDIX family)